MNATVKKELQHYLRTAFRGEHLVDEPLHRHAWYRIGGPADFIAFPGSVSDCTELLRRCRQLDVPSYVIGEGANLLVNDAGFRGVVINFTRSLNSVARNGVTVEAGSGALLRKVVLFCERQGLSAVEYLAGIPGTVGGALAMNAGTDHGEIGDCVAGVDLLNESDELLHVDGAAVGFGYRAAPLLRNKTLLGCRLRCRPADSAELRRTREELLGKRAAKQPLEYPSCGSVFKRPAGHYVGKLVQESGLKGLRHGDAMISDKHCGFIVNLGHATAADVTYLIAKVTEVIHARYGIMLELEVRLLGF